MKTAKPNRAELLARIDRLQRENLDLVDRLETMRGQRDLAIDGLIAWNGLSSKPAPQTAAE